MLHLSCASKVDVLAAALAEVLSEPLAEPMTPEWVAVPTLGMRRWLALELARSLGASGPRSGDGVAANIVFTFPGALRQAVLQAGRDAELAEPWQLEHLVWAVLEVLSHRSGDPRLGPVASLVPGATPYGRARRLADLFDRYAVRRPGLLVAWLAGNDVDANGRELKEHDRWQPHLWRLTRDRIGEPSPAERLPELLAAARSGTLALELPERLAFFGLTSLPGGAPFLELVEALGAHRAVHVLLLDPSPEASRAVRAATLSLPPPAGLQRSDDRSSDFVEHPLLRSWGRAYRERAILLAVAEGHGLGEARSLDRQPSNDDAPPRLLRRIQDDLRNNRPPRPSFVLASGDNSVQIHSCHGPGRQVEILRDAILHLLAEDETLREDDIVVLCPAIERFAPLVEAGFGTSADGAVSSTGPLTPKLRYRIADRSLRESHPVLSALDALLALVSGRCTATEVLDFLSLAPVRARFDFDEDSLARLADWIAETRVHWGLDAAHRVPWGLPADFSDNTWRAALDRLLIGVAVSDDDVSLAVGGVAPCGVEGNEIALAGRFAEAVSRLSALAEECARPRTATSWCETLARAGDDFFAVGDEQVWQVDQLGLVLADIDDTAVISGEPAPVELTLADVRRLLADKLTAASRQPSFFRGGITVTSLTPLRGLPFRVVCLLGIDEDALGSGPLDGDDLTAAAPCLGDGDARSETRQGLLEAVLSAQDHLVITFSGHSLRTNAEVPPAVCLAELRDTIAMTIEGSSTDAGEARKDPVTIVHPRQPFDDRCFVAGALREATVWSFDATAFAGACARRQTGRDPQPFMAVPLEPSPEHASVIDLADLRSFFAHPVRTFLQRRLGLAFMTEDRSPCDDLPTALRGLDDWNVANRLISARLAGHLDEDWARHERALGTLPAGGLGELNVMHIEQTVGSLLERAMGLGVNLALGERRPIDARLGDGARIVGAVDIRCGGPAPGPGEVTYTRAKPRQVLGAWVNLLALSIEDPAVAWRSVVVRRAEDSSRKEPDVVQLVCRGETPDARYDAARRGLEVAVDCYRRGMLEPIPLFAQLSYKLHQGTADSHDWRDRDGRGDGDDEANHLAFGDLELSELRDLPAREDDPPGTAPGRAERFARYLWSAVEESTESLG